MPSVWSIAGEYLSIEVTEETAPSSNGHGANTPKAGSSSSNGHSTTSNGHSGTSSGQAAVRGKRFAEAFDAGEVVWFDDLPVFASPAPGLTLRRSASGTAGQVVSPPVPSRPPEGPVTQAVPSPSRRSVAPERTSQRVSTARGTAVTRLRPRPDTALLATPAHLVWLALVPVGLLGAVAALMAPWVAPSIFPAPSWNALSSITASGQIRPEPFDQMRYLAILAVPLLLIPLVAMAWKQVTGMRRRRQFDLVVNVVQVVGLSLVAVCWVRQGIYHRWFSNWNLIAAVIAAFGLLVLARTTSLFRVGSTTQRRGFRVLVLSIVLVLSGLWLLPAVFNESSLAIAHPAVPTHIEFTFDEFLSATNGRTALVDFIPQYTRLLPYAAQPVLGAFGSTVTTFTWTMWALSLFAVLGIYLMFRVVTGNPLTALIMYVPFLAVTMTAIRVPEGTVYLANFYGVLPLRVLGPFVMAWLCARELSRPRRAGPPVLFFLAGLVAINNPEFGFPCFAALFAALACGRRTMTSGWRPALWLAAEAVMGALASLGALLVLALVRSSSLPRWDYLNHFQRIFAVEGFGLIPMPLFGLHVVIYLTFLAAIVGGVVGARNPSSPQSRVLNGMLVYSGVLGLGALSYWVGRSHPEALFGMFPTWGLCVALLSYAVLRATTGPARPSTATLQLWGLPSLATLVVFGLMVSVVPKLPSPSAELRRIGTDARGASGSTPTALEVRTSFDWSRPARFVSDHTQRGERVAILANLGHGIAERSGVIDVSPYANQSAIVFVEQMTLLLEAIDDSGARKIFLSPPYSPEVPTYLQLAGYSVTAKDADSNLQLWQRSG